MSLVILSGCSSLNLSKRDNLYWADASLIVADGYTTYRAMNNNKYVVKEIGPFANAMFGSNPTDYDILIFTSFKIGLLELSRHMLPIYSKAFQYSILFSHSYAVMHNIQYNF